MGQKEKPSPRSGVCCPPRAEAGPSKWQSPSPADDRCALAVLDDRNGLGFTYLFKSLLSPLQRLPVVPYFLEMEPFSATCTGPRKKPHFPASSAAMYAM